MGIKRLNLNELLPALVDGTQIIVPNLRIKDAILSQFLETFQRGIAPTPHIDPIDVYIKKRWTHFAKLGIIPCKGKQILESHEEHLLWIQIIESSLAEIPLLNPEDTANTVSQSYRLAKQWIDQELFANELKKNTGIPDNDVFAQWVKSFNKLCRDKNYISLVDATQELVALASDEARLNDERPTLLVNFYDPPPLYQKLLKRFDKVTSCLMANTGEKQCQPTKSKIEFIDQNSEVQYCVKWIQETISSHPDAHIGIVSCNPNATRKMLEQAFFNKSESTQLFSNTQNTFFNSTGNYDNLNESAVVYDALLILGLGAESHTTTDLIRILQSPYFHVQNEQDNENGLEEANISLARHLFELGKPSISTRELASISNKEESTGYYPEFASRVLELKTKLRKVHHTTSPIQWQQIFAEVLTDFGWPGNLHTTYEENTAKQWQLLLSKLASLSTITPKLSYYEALNTLRLLATRTTQYSHFDSSLAVSFFSPADAIGFEYDYLWLLGFNDQQWPEAVNPSPFIANALQKSANLPGSHSEVQLNNAKAQFELLLASTAKQVHASFHKSDGEQEFRASGFLSDFETQEVPFPPISLSPYSQVELKSNQYDVVFDQRHSLAAGEILEGGAALISDQSSCPFKAFAINRLQVSGDPNIEPGLSKAARGNVLHTALEHFYKSTISSQELLELSASELTERINNAVSVAVEQISVYNREIMTPRIQSIEISRLSKLISEFLLEEKQRPAFRVIAREHRLSKDFGKLRLNLRIDRIDELQDKGTALIDYKTGKYTAPPKNWMNERPEDLQLPLYHVVASDTDFNPAEAVAVAHINVEKIGYTGTAAKANFAPGLKPIEQEKWTDLSWEQITEYWRDLIDSLAGDFQKGVCDVNPVDSTTTCTYCGLQSLCRIQELSTAKSENDGDKTE